MSFAFEARSPGRLRGELFGPLAKTLAYDGKTLYELSPAQRRLTRYQVALSREEGALLLTRLFAPFASEGFRAPLIRSTGLTWGTPDEDRRVALTQHLEGGAVRYLFRWPSLDFLEKSIGSSTDRVDAEHCEATLDLCVPTRITHLEEGRAVGTTVYSELSLNPELPTSRFSLEAPAGFVRRDEVLDAAHRFGL